MLSDFQKKRIGFLYSKKSTGNEKRGTSKFEVPLIYVYPKAYWQLRANLQRLYTLQLRTKINKCFD